MFPVPTRIPIMLVHISLLLALAAGDSPAVTLPRSLPTKRRLSGGEWTAYYSEEGGEALCNGLVTGMRCRGKYCDDVSLECDQSTLGDTYSHSWTKYFSEETGGLICGGEGYITGVKCQGKYCDDVSIRCSSVRTRSSPTNCRWSSWFSEEDGAKVDYANSYFHGMRCSGKYCDNKQAYVCDSQPQCLVSSAEGYWQQRRTIASAQTETLSWGLEATHETSTTKEWSSSMSTTVTAGFEAKGFGFSAEVSHEVAKQVGESVSAALTTTETHEIEYQYTDANIGQTLWQFVFKSRDSCSYEETVATKQFAFTEGAFREPCCLPGWALDAPAYTQCRAGGLISNSHDCTAVSLMGTYERLASGSCPAERQVSKYECLAAAKAVDPDISKTHLDGGSDSGMNGRPQGCTIHDRGAVEWWGPSDNAPCGNMNYNCVCKMVVV